MTWSDWLNLFGSIGLVSAGSLFGSFITIFIKHFLDKNRLKTERQSNLQREIYFNLQKQAGKMFEELNLEKRQVDEIKFWLAKGVCTPITNISVIEKITNVSLAQVYFSKEIIEQYNQISIIFNNIATIYFETGKNNILSQDDCNKINGLISNFNVKSNDLVNLVLLELEKNKKLIL